MPRVLINRTFVNRHTEILLKLYLSLARPKLEYCIQAWRPYLKKDIDLLEKVQKRATRMVITEKGLTYEERLRKLGITTLEMRRLRGDLIEVFKIFKGFDDIKHTDFSSGQIVGERGGTAFPFRFWRGNAVTLAYTAAVGGRGGTPPYLAESVCRTADVEGRRQLLSCTTTTLVVLSAVLSKVDD